MIIIFHKLYNIAIFPFDRLTEIGPRLSLTLTKIQEGICDGEVLFHEYIEKTDEELKLQAEMRKKRMLVIFIFFFYMKHEMN